MKIKMLDRNILSLMKEVEAKKVFATMVVKTTLIDSNDLYDIDCGMGEDELDWLIMVTSAKYGCVINITGSHDEGGYFCFSTFNSKWIADCFVKELEARGHFVDGILDPSVMGEDQWQVEYSININ